MKKKIKLQTRLLLSVGLVVGFALLSAALFMSMVWEKSLENQELKRIHMRSESITRRMGQLMYSSNWRNMMIALQGDLNNDTSMLYFFVMAPDGEILICDDKNMVGTFEPQRVPRKVLEDHSVFKNYYHTQFGGDAISFNVYKTTLRKDAAVDGVVRAKKGELVFDTFWTVEYMGKQMGLLRMGFSRADLVSKVCLVKMSILGGGGVLLVIVLAMIAISVKRSMAPLEEFTRRLVHIQDVSCQEGLRQGLAEISFDRMPVSTLEIKNLKSAFESLRQTLASTWQDLEGHQTKLEANVLERTAELKTANLELERRMQERREIEALLVNSQKLEAVGILAGGVAHDFNNLLMGILGNASLIEHNTDPSDGNNEKAKKIVDLVNTGAELVRQLLGFARGGKYAPILLDINQIIKANLHMFGRTRKDLEIQSSLEPDIWNVMADQSQMGQVVVNLFLNASEAMPKGGVLSIETRNVSLDPKTVKPHGAEPGNFVKMSVTDYGEGMDEMILTRVFDPFFTTKQMGRGTGLGLASVYGIVKNHNGFVTVESKLGKGSVFSVFLPGK